ncbi:MAG: glycosyltransferase family 4 protein [candidate division NC10 bacterium]|nr:glycosyltransferase family 4 protein [candidate division NC10 bacterium]
MGELLAMRVCVLTVVHVHHDNRIFYKQILTLRQAGYEVTYVVPCPPEVRSLEGVELVPLPLVPRWRRPQNWWRAMKAGLRSKADLFHFHDPELIGVGLLLRLLTGRPVIYDVHENYPQVMLRRLWIPAPLRRLVGKGMAALEWVASYLLDGVVVANPPTWQRFRKRGRRAALVGNYVDLEGFDGETGPPLFRAQGPYFIYSGSLSSQRGVLDCLAAFERLSREDVNLLLVGPLDDADASVANLPDRLPRGAYLLPAQPFRALPPLLRASVAGLVTLRPTPNYLEILPTKLLEYMAASIPVIAYDLPLVRPIVEGARCGLLVEPHDVEGLAKSMAYLLDHPFEAKEMGKRGRRAVMERYSWEAESRKLLALYREVLGPPEAQRVRKSAE